MSFQDIETGLLNTTSSFSPTPQSREDAAFLTLQQSLSLQVFKMNANVQGMLKLVDQLGTAKDSASLRKSLHDLTETTRAMAKRGSEDLKKLSALQANLPQQKTALQKTSHDLQVSLVAFQRAQQVSAERQRTVVQGVKLAVEDEHTYPARREDVPPPSSPEQRQAQLLQSQLSPHELAYQESLIQEREAEIHEIETGIHELAEIFRDLGTLVNQQGSMIDNIELNISSVAADTGSAAEELTTAAEYQRKAGRRAACLMLIVVFVVAIVLLAMRFGDYKVQELHWQYTRTDTAFTDDF
ncbi:t-SNARE [Amanita muscaria]